jgi:cytochrome c556
MMKRILVGLALVFVLTAVAYAQFANAEKAIKYRKAMMTLVVHHFGSMGAVVKGKAPYDAADFAAHATAVEMISSLGWDSFLSPGSDKGDTTMTSAALKNPAKFLAAADAFQAATAKLVSTADGGDLSKIKPQFGAVAQTCGGCHKPFRK